MQFIKSTRICIFLIIFLADDTRDNSYSQKNDSVWQILMLSISMCQ